MKPKFQFRGICRTCKHEMTCAFPREPSRSVLQCHEFEGFVPECAAGIRGSGALSAEIGGSDAAATASLETGLCYDCEVRDTCALPGARQGVRDCDEHR